MKKIMLFAAACLALAACSKDIDTTSPEIGDGSAFEKGQKVTLTVKTGDQTKVSSELETSGADKDKINFKWQSGDIIKVTVGTKSAEFTLSSGAGEATAEFTGTMPAAGDNFDVQYPSTEPDLATQAYSATEALPHDKMKMAATGCTLGNSFRLAPEYAALRLNLYGGAREVSQIVVTCSSSSTYTLSISPAVTVGKDKDNATPFFIVLPATESFASAAVTASAIAATTENTPTYTEGTFSGAGIPISASTTFIATEAKSLSPGSILNMPAVSLTTVWAPVNCGYDDNHLCGKLYQWGRMDGSGYYTDATATVPAQDANNQVIQTNLVDLNKGTYTTSEPASNSFYINPGTDTYDWYTSSTSAQFSSWPMTAPSNTSRIGNPCPSGWRVPTSDELGNLVYSDWDSSKQDGNTKRTYTFSSGYGTINGLTLPAAGFRKNNNGDSVNRGSTGYYWSSAVSGNSFHARNVLFYSGYVGMVSSLRANGFSVRCVQE